MELDQEINKSKDESSDHQQRRKRKSKQHDQKKIGWDILRSRTRHRIT